MIKRSPRKSTTNRSRFALLLIDVINDLAFPEAEDLLRQALPMARRLERLKERCAEKGISTIYVNDNFGRWRSDFRAVIRHCLADDSPGRPIVERLLPNENDYFVLKPAHSGFFSTTLEVLLSYLQVDTLILTGVAGDICVLYTANDAYMRGFQLVVPRDCVASNSPDVNRRALSQMSKLLKADIRPSPKLRFKTQAKVHQSSTG
jgi:nicotinamidase-related amidase